jgi:tetratricopeptide (TPR) repeat protein
MLSFAAGPRLCAGTPWFVSYEKALQAQEKGDWQTSIRLLKEAIAEKGTPRLKAKTYGLRFVNYLPYYHLGLAYYRLNDRRSALEYLEKSEQYGQIADAPDEYTMLTRMKAELTGTTVPSPPPVASAQAAQDTTRAEKSGNAETLPWYVNYETGLAYIESGDWLKAVESLRRALATDRHPREYARTYGMWFISYFPNYYLGVAYYNQRLWQLAVKYFEASRQAGELENMDEERARLREYLDEARKREGTGKKPVSEEVKELVSQKLDEAIRLFNMLEFAESQARFNEVLHLDPYNSVAKIYLDRIAGESAQSDSSGSTSDYLAGVAQYFKGNIDEAIVLLRSAKPGFRDDPNLHAYLGAAYASHYLRSGKKQTTSLRNAQESFRQALKLNPRYTLDGRVFPREVVAMFLQVKKGAGKLK